MIGHRQEVALVVVIQAAAHKQVPQVPEAILQNGNNLEGQVGQGVAQGHVMKGTGSLQKAMNSHDVKMNQKRKKNQMVMRIYPNTIYLMMILILKL